MKKALILVLAILLASTVFSTIAMAAPEGENPLIEITTVTETEETETASDLGILPDSPFYFLKRFFESFQLAFTFNPESKAAKLMELAELRLAELAALPYEKQTKFTETLTQAFVETMEEAEELLEEELEEDELEQQELDEDDQLSDYQDKLEDVLETFEDAKEEKEEILAEISELQDELNELAASNEVSEEEVNNLQTLITAQISFLSQIDELLAVYSGRIGTLQQEVGNAAVAEKDLEEIEEAFDTELDILFEEIEDSLDNLEEALEEVKESIEDDEDKDDEDDDNEEDDEDANDEDDDRGEDEIEDVDDEE